MRVFHKHVYNMRGSYAEELEKIVDHFAPLGVKRFSIVYYDDVVGSENLTAVERALKKRNLAVVSVAAFKDRAKPDIEAGVKEVAKGQPDVVILTTLYKATADFVRARAENRASAHRWRATRSRARARSPRSWARTAPGVIVATVVPPPTKRSLPIVQEYQAAIEKQLGKKDLSFTSLESYIAAKVTVEALRRAGPKLTREASCKRSTA